MKEGFSIKFIKVLLMILIFGCTCMLGKYGFMTLFAPEKYLMVFLILYFSYLPLEFILLLHGIS